MSTWCLYLFTTQLFILQQTGLVQLSSSVNSCSTSDNQQTSSPTNMTIDMNTVGTSLCITGPSWLIPYAFEQKSLSFIVKKEKENCTVHKVCMNAQLCYLFFLQFYIYSLTQIFTVIEFIVLLCSFCTELQTKNSQINTQNKSTTKGAKCFLRGSARPSILGSRWSTSVSVGMCNCRDEVAYILLVSVIDFAVTGQVKHCQETQLRLNFLLIQAYFLNYPCFKKLKIISWRVGKGLLQELSLFQFISVSRDLELLYHFSVSCYQYFDCYQSFRQLICKQIRKVEV